MLLLLSFVYEARPILRAERTLAAKVAQRQAFAAETVDALLPMRLRPVVLPLLEEASYGRRLMQWHATGAPVAASTLEELIATIIAGGEQNAFSLWTRMCAIQAAGILEMNSSACLPCGNWPRHAMPRSPIEPIHPGAATRGSGTRREGEMLSLVEKVLILKSANLFSETPDNVLADIAGLAEEVFLDAGQVVFNKGESGTAPTSLSPAPWRSGRQSSPQQARRRRHLRRTGPARSEPRLATVKTTEAAHLLRLDGSHFQTILAERPEVSAAIIRVITRYLRSLLRHGGDVDPNLPRPSLKIPGGGIRRRGMSGSRHDRRTPGRRFNGCGGAVGNAGLGVGPPS